MGAGAGPVPFAPLAQVALLRGKVPLGSAIQEQIVRSGDLMDVYKSARGRS